MADDAAGAVRRTPRPARDEATPKTLDEVVEQAAWSLWRADGEPTGVAKRDPYRVRARALAADGLLANPARQRPVVLLRAEDCACPVGGDCPHGPEPVDALELAVWLHAEAEWWLGQYKHDVVLWKRQLDEMTQERNTWEAEYERVRDLKLADLPEALSERDGLQTRIDAALALADKPLDWLGIVDEFADAIRAALQGDQPTEPRHELVLKSGLSGVTGACSCGGWTGGGQHELPSRVAHRWDAEHLSSLALQQAGPGGSETGDKT